MADHEYPSWDAFLGNSWFNLVVKHAHGGIGVVNHKDCPIPLILFPLPNRAINPISENTRCTVVFDLINAFPYPVPVFFIMVAVFNDHNDPLWSIKSLPVTHLQGDENDFEVAMRCANLKKINRRAPLAFCNDQRECALIIMEPTGKAIFKNIVPLTTPLQIADEDTDRIREIKDALNFLLEHKRPKDFYTFEAASDKIHMEFAVMIKRLEGGATLIPRNRDIIKARSEIFSLVFDSGRLVRREHVAQRNDGEFGKVKYDIFVSHAHVDHSIASDLVKQLTTLSPSLRIFITDPKDSSTFENDPMYFLTASRQSRSILFIATPNSLERPMTHMEIGLNADKPIMSLFWGWPDRSSLDDWLDDNIYISVPRSNIFSGVDADEYNLCIQRLASLLNLELPDEIHEIAKPANNPKVVAANYDPTSQYITDYQRMVNFVQKKQTPEEVEKLMKQFFDGYKFDNERDKKVVMGFSPHMKLCFMLEAVGADDRRLMLLRMFPSLVDDELLKALYFLEIEKSKEAGSSGHWIKPLMKIISQIIGNKE